MNLISSIAAIMSELEGIGKNQRNEQQHYDFRGIEDITAALQKLLAKHQVVILPQYGTPEYANVVSAKGTPMIQCHIEGKFEFCGAEGESKIVTTFGEALDTGDKATNKAMTAAYKYALLQVFAISKGQEDADKDSPERGSAPKTPTQHLAELFRANGIIDKSLMASAVRDALNDLEFDPDAKLSALSPEDAQLVIRQVALNQGWDA